MIPQYNYFTCLTLVDITATGVTRDTVDLHKRNQQRNWETVIQTIGIGAQPLEISRPETIEIDLEYLEFGKFYQDTHQVWIFNFAVEHHDVFLKDDDPTGRLTDLFGQVPIICGLDETARFILPIFYCEGAIKNIYFKAGHFNINSY